MPVSPPSQSPGPHSPKARLPKNYNRIQEILALLHETNLLTERKLARDCGVSVSQLNRVRRGECVPSFFFMWALARSLERHVGRPIDPRDLLNFDGTYPTSCLHDLLDLPRGEG